MFAQVVSHTEHEFVEGKGKHTHSDGRGDRGCLALSDCKARHGGKEPKILPAILTNK